MFSNFQEEEIKDQAAKIEHAEQRLATLSYELKVPCFIYFSKKKIVP